MCMGWIITTEVYRFLNYVFMSLKLYKIWMAYIMSECAVGAWALFYAHIHLQTSVWMMLIDIGNKIKRNPYYFPSIKNIQIYSRGEEFLNLDH